MNHWSVARSWINRQNNNMFFIQSGVSNDHSTNWANSLEKMYEHLNPNPYPNTINYQTAIKLNDI